MGLRDIWYSFRRCRTPEESEPGRLATIIAASRLCVIPMTFYAVSIGALLAWLEGSWNTLVYLSVLAGFILAHLLDNLVNDYYDYKRGLDDPGYFRRLYGPHPFIDRLLTPRQLAVLAGAIMLYNSLLAVVLSLKVTPLIAVLAAIGALVMAFYAGIGFDAKKTGLGELLLIIVWGPVMAGGTLLAIAHKHPLAAAPVYLAFATTITLVLIGKHLDKLPVDRTRGLRTLPARLGEDRAKKLAAAIAALAPPSAALAAYYYTGHPLSLLPLLALPTGLLVARALLAPRPTGKPPGWDVWPLWHAAIGYIAMDSTGRTLIAGLLATGLAVSGHTWLSWIVVALAVASEALNLAVAARILRLIGQMESRG